MAEGCYSDHDHDIEHVGMCEMCGEVDPIGRLALFLTEREAQVWAKRLLTDYT